MNGTAYLVPGWAPENSLLFLTGLRYGLPLGFPSFRPLEEDVVILHFHQE